MTHRLQGTQDIGRHLNWWHTTTGGPTCLITLVNIQRHVIYACEQRSEDSPLLVNFTPFRFPKHNWIHWAWTSLWSYQRHLALMHLLTLSLNLFCFDRSHSYSLTRLSTSNISSIHLHVCSPVQLSYVLLVSLPFWNRQKSFIVICSYFIWCEKYLIFLYVNESGTGCMHVYMDGALVFGRVGCD